jgi:class 3 adenylate cyclase
MVWEGSDSGPGFQVFLIADIRGYTRFTQDHGDAAAAELASKFGTVVAEGVAGHGGRLMELRGDEALVSFGSPRLALTCAVELQRRFLDETMSDRRLPLGVGIGIDVGEAVPVDEGYRGGALNVAARLCARAAPGEILATREVTHLARTIPEVRYEPQRSVALKGLDVPVNLVKVVPAGEDLAASFRGLLRPARTDTAGRRRHRRRRLLLGTGLATAAVIAGTLALTRSSGDVRLDIRGGVGLVDAESSRLLMSIEAPSGAVAIAPDGVWVAEAAGDGEVV